MRRGYEPISTSQQYTGDVYRVYAFFAAFAGTALWFLIFPTKSVSGNPTSLLVVAVGLFGLMSAAMLPYVLRSFTVYETDDEQLVERSLFATRRLRWRDIAEYDEGGGTSVSRITLIDNGGARFSIPFDLLLARGKGLREQIDTRLTPLRKRQADEFAASERTLRRTPLWSAAVLGGVGALFIIGAVCLFVTLHDGSRVGLSLMLGVLGGLLAGLGGYSFGQRLILSKQELRLVSPFGERRIALENVESVFLYETKTKDQTFELMTLTAGGVKTRLTSTMPDYPLVRAAILQNVPPEAIQHGARDREVYDRQQKRTVLWIVSVCSVLLAGIGCWFSVNFYSKVQRIERLARYGVQTTAQVTGRDCGCGSEKLKNVEFRFEANGRTYTGENTLSGWDAAVHMGDRVPIVYLPNHPAENRLQMLMDWRPFALRNALPLILFLTLPLVLPFSVWKSLRQAEKSA